MKNPRKNEIFATLRVTYSVEIPSITVQKISLTDWTFQFKVYHQSYRFFDFLGNWTEISAHYSIRNLSPTISRTSTTKNLLQIHISKYTAPSRYGENIYVLNNLPQSPADATLSKISSLRLHFRRKPSIQASKNSKELNTTTRKTYCLKAATILKWSAPS